ncbi:MAG: DUF494 family protein [Bacteroidota bacterium]
MYERVVEIILFLVSELKTSKQLSDVDVSLLSRNGYTQSEISTAFSWLFDRMSVGQHLLGESAANTSSHRVLHELEKMVINPEAHGYLLQWHELGLLSNGDMETLIERIMAAGFSTVGVDEMKSFIAGMLFDPDPNGGPGRVWFDGTDSIH